jgi:putative GTP pyrophosphokinase
VAVASSANTPTATHPAAKGVNKACQRLAVISADMREGKLNIDELSELDLEVIEADIELIEGWRKLHAVPLRNASANLRHYVRPYMAQGVGVVSVTQRLKKYSTIVDKQERYPTMRLTKMEDIGGVRAVLATQTDADDISRKLRKNWKISRYRDYVRTPKESGYRALHLTAVKQGMRIEVQLRTYLQDYWANQVERDSRHLRVDYKSGKGNDEVHAYYVSMSELLVMREASTVPSEAFNEELRRRYMLAQPYLASRQDEE